MRAKHKFRPSGEWALEDRVALSHASPAAEIASAAAPLQGLRANFRGRFNAIPPLGLGGESQANLVGSARVGNLGNVRLTGSLASNPSLPPSSTNTHGFVFLVSRRAGGVVTAEVTGPSADLTSRQPTLTPLNFRVISAPPRLNSLIGTEGTATLLLRPRGRNLAPGGNVHGQFTLRVVQS